MHVGFCIIMQKEIVRDQNEITGEYVTLNRIARRVERELQISRAPRSRCAPGRANTVYTGKHTSIPVFCSAPLGVFIMSRGVVGA